jgi:Fe-S-cluster containining protein
MISLNLVTDKTRFQCQRCTKCCSLDVMLSEREMNELNPKVDRAWHTTKKTKRGSRFICCFLEGVECSIYAKRPLLCRLYPFFAVPSEQLALLREPLQEGALAITGSDGNSIYFIFDDNCPGVGKGETIALDSILQMTLQHLSEMEAKSH